MNKSALSQKGFIASPIVLVGVAVVVLVIIGIASGGLKGSFKITTNQQAPAGTTSQGEPTPTSAPQSNTSFKTYTSTSMNFSFEYPENWKVQEGSSNVTIALMEEGKTNNAAALITAMSGPLGNSKDLQFASIVDMQKVAIKKEFGNSSFTVDKATKVGGLEARLLEFSGSMSGNPLTGKYLTTADKENIYAITVLADTDKWSKYSGDLQKALDSFKILK